MKALITGAGPNSFLGQKLYRHLLADPTYSQVVGTTHFSEDGRTYENRNSMVKGCIVECQLDKPLWVVRLLSQYKPGIIFHISGIGSPNTPAHDLYKSHVDSTLNLLNALNQPNRPAFIHISSIVVEGNPLSVYGAAKLGAEALVKSYNSLGKIYGISVRSCAISGGGARHGLIPDILRKIFDNNLKELELFGDSPGSRKPFMYVNNFIDLLTKLPSNIDWYRFNPLTICPNDTISVAEVAEMAMSLSGKRKPVSWLGKDSVFSQDNNYINPLNSSRLIKHRIESSRDNVELIIKDILKKDYGIK